MDLLTWIFGYLFALCLSPLRAEEAAAGAAAGASEPCGGRLDATDAGYITTPGYPLEYPPHQDCRWVITAPEPSQRIVLNFNPHFELEKLDCRYDFIEIRDGHSEAADLLGRHCSNIAPPAIISSGPVLHIRFVSDYAHQGAGFSLRYEIFKTGSDCSRNFTSLSGVIESPGFPDKYPHNLECNFIIIVPPHMDVTLTFLTFDLENDPLQGAEGECKYDWLEIYDGLPQVGPLIGRHCGTKIPPEIRSSTGILSLSFHTDMAVAKDGFSARYNMTHKDVSDNFHCSNALGMKSGLISDDQISASSVFYDGRWNAQQARLHNEDHGWTPSTDTQKEFIQVDLQFLKLLTGIATQGAVSKQTQKQYYVTSFKLEVSTNGEDWMVYRNGKNHKIFHANSNPTDPVLNRIPQPVLARFVRIRPQTWKTGIALRFELYGCQITDQPCSEMQGMLSGALPDSQILASSMRDLHAPTGVARLVASRSGWFPSPAQAQAKDEWLQVDLGVTKAVRGVITQGARGMDGGSSTESRAYVKKYRLAHSLNGKDWTYLMDTKTSQPKIFEGNTHFDTPEIRRFNETIAQFIRIYPERWSPAGIGMRMEVLGCDLPESTTVPGTTSPTLPPVETTTTQKASHMYPSMSPWLGGLCDFEQSLCGWSHDPMTPLHWSLHSASSPIAPAPSLDLTLASDDYGNFLYLEAGPKLEHQRARLLSPSLGPDVGPLCLLFFYRIEGPEAQGHLRVMLRDHQQEETLLWSLRGDQGPLWREGRTILPQSPNQYQVVIEGYFEHGNRGSIWIDNIHMSSNTELDQCTQPLSAVPPDWTESRTVDFRNNRLFNGGRGQGGLLLSDWTTPVAGAGSAIPPVTRVPSSSGGGLSDRDAANAWLYSLDPILLTIIVMSSLGVLLGAVCAGLLLYCTCSYHGLQSRSSTTLENYNFELYDGIKHKVKINQQRCCSEA
ncbi:neuropilin-2b isoform X2 [Engraulis encrasicolus]|uniref:neuropilin-2b isoform X2 n=1 Tax=Engraulis encrasicolus TaxID=184585 RepID=UPI002FCEE7AA